MNLKQRCILMSLVLSIIVAAFLWQLSLYGFAVVAFIAGIPIFTAMWRHLDSLIRVRVAMYKYEQRVLPTPSTTYYTPSTHVDEPMPKQEQPSRYEEPMSMY